MEAAQHCMYLLDTGDRLGLPDRIDDAGMSARTDDHQSLVFQIEAGRMFVDVLIGHRLADHLGRQITDCITTCSVLEAKLDTTVGQDTLDAGSIDLTCVKACPRMTVGLSQSTVSTLCAARRRRSRMPKSTSWFWGPV
jgi:hypothetical protein